MTQETVCSRCGAEFSGDLSGGLCPKCLMQMGLEDESATPMFYAGETKELDRDGDAPIDEDLGFDVGAVQEPPGRYSVLGQHGRGGMGRILLVHDEHLGRDIALKELLPELSEGATPTPARHSKDMVARFLREAKITGQLEHPSITPVHELGRRADGTLYYTMKLVRGENFGAKLQKATSLPDRLKLLPHFVDLCQAIAYAHSRNVIHRDIKPGNVMIGDFGETVVIDWGLAKVLGKKDIHADRYIETLSRYKKEGRPSVGQTEYGMAFGTPAYMPPEQAKGQLELIDERSDVYSLGAVLYQLLTGQPPFHEKTVTDTLRKVVEEEPRPVKSMEPQAPTELVAICQHAMRKEPAKRYKSAQELATDIERFQTGAMVSVYEYKFSEHLWRFVKRNKAPLAMATIAIAAVLGAGAYSYVNTIRSNNALRIAEEKERTQRVAAENALYRTKLLVAGRHIDNEKFELAREQLWDTPESVRNWEWGRLVALAYPEIRSYYGHNQGIAGLQFSPDGKSFASVSRDKNAIIWNLADGKETLRLKDLDGLPLKLRWSAAGDTILILTDTGRLICWDTVKNAKRYILGDDTTSFTDFVISYRNDRFAAIVDNVQLRLYDWASGDLQIQTSERLVQISRVDFSRNDDFVLAKVGERAVLIWDTAKLALQREIQLDDNIVGARFAPNANELALVLYDAIQIRDFVTDKELERYTIDLGRFLPEIGFDEWQGKLYASDGTRIMRFDRGTQKLESVSTSVGYPLAWFDTDSGVRAVTRNNYTGIVIVENGREIPLNDPFWNVSRYELSKDGRELLTGYGDGTIRRWSVPTRGRTAQLIGAVAYSKDLGTAVGNALNVNYGHNHVREQMTYAIDPIEQRELAAVATSSYARTNQVSAIAPGGDLAATALAVRQNEHEVVIWRTSDAGLVDTLPRDCGCVTSMKWSPADANIVIGNREGVLRNWDRMEKRFGEPFAIHSGEVQAIELADGGATCISADDQGGIVVWNVESGEIRLKLEGHAGPVGALTVDEAKRLLASGGNDKTVRLWDLNNGACLNTFPGHDNAVTGVALPSGLPRLFSLTVSGVVSVRDIDSAELVTQFYTKTPLVLRSRGFLGYDGSRKALIVSDDFQAASPWESAAAPGSVYEKYDTRIQLANAPAGGTAPSVVHFGRFVCSADLDEAIYLLSEFAKGQSSESISAEDSGGFMLDEGPVSGACNDLGLGRMMHLIKVDGHPVRSVAQLLAVLEGYRATWQTQPEKVLEVEQQDEYGRYLLHIYVRATERLETETTLPSAMVTLMVKEFRNLAERQGIAQFNADLEWDPGLQIDNAPASYQQALQRIGFEADDAVKGINGVPLTSYENYDRITSELIAGLESKRVSQLQFDLKRGAYVRVVHTVHVAP